MPDTELLAELRALRTDLAQWRQEQRASEAERQQIALKGVVAQRWLVVLQSFAAAIWIGIILLCIALWLWDSFLTGR